MKEGATGQGKRLRFKEWQILVLDIVRAHEGTSYSLGCYHTRRGRILSVVEYARGRELAALVGEVETDRCCSHRWRATKPHAFNAPLPLGF